jgi:hypothetical protein
MDEVRGMSLSEIQKARLWWKTLPTEVREKIVLREYEDSNQLVLKFPQVDMAGASNYPDDEIGGMGDMYIEDEVDKEYNSRAAWETALAVELDGAVSELINTFPKYYLKEHSICAVSNELRKQAVIDMEASK